MKLFVNTNQINTGTWIFYFRWYLTWLATAGWAGLTKVLVCISMYGRTLVPANRGFCFLILTRVWPKVVPKLFSEQLYCSLLSSNDGGAKKQDMAVYTAVDLLYCCKKLYY